MTPPPTSIRSSVRWNALALGGRQGLRVVSSLVIAALIGQEAFGIGGLAVAYSALVIAFVGLGIDIVIVQREELEVEHVGAATLISLGVGLAAFGLTLVFAPLLADVFRVPELTSALPVVGSLALIQALAVVPTGLLMRRMAFQQLAIAELVGTVLGVGVGLAIAIAERTYWAIIAQLLIMHGVSLVGILLVQRGFAWRTTRTAVRDVATSCTQLLGTSLVNFAVMNGDTMIVGRQLGPAAVADYSIAYRVLSLPSQMIGTVIARTVLPVFSRLQDDPPAIAQLYYRANRSMAVIVTGPLMIVAFAAEPIVRLGLGESWTTAVPAVQWMCAAACIRMAFAVDAQVLVAFGKLNWQFYLSVVAAVVAIIGFAVGSRWGTAGVAASLAITRIPMTLLLLAVVARLIPVTLGGSLYRLRHVLVGAIALTAVWLALAPLTESAPELLDLALRAVAALGAYGAVVLVAPEVRTDLIRLVRPDGSR